MIRRITAWYGANPLHLLALIASFALTGYAAERLLAAQPVSVLIWFLGAAIGHDLILFPLYALADFSAARVLTRRPADRPPGPWINYLRFPAVISGILLLVWFPLIARDPQEFEAAAGYTADPYLERWLAVTGILFGISALGYALRIGRAARRPAPDR
ncbi:MAG: hypothetical protein ACRDTC_20570 [Pseudonocardiaceae bacterium]